jgi:hypothetical protein
LISQHLFGIQAGFLTNLEESMPPVFVPNVGVDLNQKLFEMFHLHIPHFESSEAPPFVVGAEQTLQGAFLLPENHRLVGSQTPQLNDMSDFHNSLNFQEIFVLLSPIDLFRPVVEQSYEAIFEKHALSSIKQDSHPLFEDLPSIYI